MYTMVAIHVDLNYHNGGDHDGLPFHSRNTLNIISSAHRLGSSWNTIHYHMHYTCCGAVHVHVHVHVSYMPVWGMQL